MAESASRRRLHMKAELESYSRSAERRLQYDMVSLLEEAADWAGLDHSSWDLREAGGGLSVAMGDVDGALVLGDFVPQLDVLLEEYNACLELGARLRVRLALVRGDDAEGPERAAARLAGTEAVRATLADAERANMVVVIDGRLFDDVVRERMRGLRPEAWVEACEGAGYIGVPA